MTLFPTSHDRDTELLSAYLDHQLSPAERAQLERRLETDSQLRAALDGLRYAKTTLTALPKVKPPRNFTLTPAMVGQASRTRRQPSPLIPALNWVTALAAIVLAVLVVTERSGGLRLETAQPAAAPEVAVAQESLPVTEEDGAALKSFTPTPEETEAQSLAAPALEPSAEPLTGEAGVGGGAGGAPVPPSGEPLTGVGGGGAGGDGAPEGVGITAATPDVLGYAADANAITPTADDSLRVANAAETATPIPTVAAAPTQTQASTQTPTPPLLFAELVALALLILFIVMGLIVRRR